MKRMVRVGPDRVVTLRYRMTNEDGEVVAIATRENPVAFVYGSGEILPALETPLNGMRAGQKKDFSVSQEVAPGLQGTFHFEVIIDDVWWVQDDTRSQPREDAVCGPTCSCHAS